MLILILASSCCKLQFPLSNNVFCAHLCLKGRRAETKSTKANTAACSTENLQRLHRSWRGWKIMTSQSAKHWKHLNTQPSTDYRITGSATSELSYFFFSLVILTPIHTPCDNLGFHSCRFPSSPALLPAVRVQILPSALVPTVNAIDRGHVNSTLVYFLLLDWKMTRLCDLNRRPVYCYHC